MALRTPTDLLGNSAWNAIAFAVALNLVVLPFVVFRLGVVAFGVAGLVMACAAPALAFSNALAHLYAKAVLPVSSSEFPPLQPGACAPMGKTPG